MVNKLLPFIYAISVFLLLLQAVKIMFRGFQSSQYKKVEGKTVSGSNDDRTGRITIHPEILNKDGDITDEDLLTVRFSRDVDPPQSADTSTE